MDRRLLMMHQVMLGDRPRLEAFDRALARVVRPGDVVVDVGAGTLILSHLALRRGASHVYAIEADPQVAALAREIARHNNLNGKLTLIQGDAREVKLPIQADVIVTELMGNLGPEEEMTDIVGNVARRNLAPGGRIIPQRMVTLLQAVEFQGEGWGVWTDDHWGLSLATGQSYAPEGAQLHFFNQAPTLLSEPAPVLDDVLGRAPSEPAGQLDLVIRREGTLHAIIGYFEATLAPGVSLANFPSYPGSCWAVWVWPLRHTDVAADDLVNVSIDQPDNVRVATEWRLHCRLNRAAGVGRP